MLKSIATDDAYPVEVWIGLVLLIVFAVLALIEGVWLYRKHKSEKTYTPIGQGKLLNVM